MPPARGAHHCAISVALSLRGVVSRGKELFQRGKMRPTVNATSGAKPRRARAASQLRCRNIHKESAIRLPPGSKSTIAGCTIRFRVLNARGGSSNLYLWASAYLLERECRVCLTLSDRVPKLASEPSARYQSAYKRFTSVCKLDDHHVGHLRTPEKRGEVR
jgi:hypothetical protein